MLRREIGLPRSGRDKNLSTRFRKFVQLTVEKRKPLSEVRHLRMIALFDEGRIPDVVHVQKEVSSYQDTLHSLQVKPVQKIFLRRCDGAGDPELFRA